MRFDEPDVREAYLNGVRDCYEVVVAGLTRQKTREVEKWLSELDAWKDGDPPEPPLGEVG